MTQTLRQVPAPVVASDFRKTLGCFPTGVAVITTITESGEPIGVTVNSFSSVSLDPPLVLWSLARKAWSMPIFTNAPGFVVNILASHQDEICRTFSRQVEDRFENVAWHPGLNGLPILNETVATLQCRHWARYDGGDHEIFVGEVMECRNEPHDPLIYVRGQLGPAVAA